jgi:hypothetical protein
VGAARTAPAVDTGGVLVAEETSVTEMPTEVVRDADAVEVLTPDEGDMACEALAGRPLAGRPLAGGPLAGGPLAGGLLIGGTPVSAGGPGGTTVAVPTGGPLAGGVAAG